MRRTTRRNKRVRTIRRSMSSIGCCCCGEKTWMLAALVLVVGLLLNVPCAAAAMHTSEKSLSITQQLKDPTAPLPTSCSLSGLCEPCPADELETTVCKTTGYRQRYSCDNPSAAAAATVAEDEDAREDTGSIQQYGKEMTKGISDSTTDDDQVGGNKLDDIEEQEESDDNEKDVDSLRDRSMQTSFHGLRVRHSRTSRRVLGSHTQRREQIVFRSCVSPAVKDQRDVMRFETMMVLIAIVCLTMAQRRNSSHRQKLSNAVNS